MSNLLLENVKKNYQAVKSIYATLGYNESYKLNTFWADQNMKDMLRIIECSHNAIEAINSIGETWLFSLNTQDSIKEKNIDWHLRYLEQTSNSLFSTPFFIQESEFTNKATSSERQGRKLTPYFLRTLNSALEIRKYCIDQNLRKSRFRIVELGAGIGCLARILKLFTPQCSYVIIDIPESLCFSYMFLKLNFPDAKFLYVTDNNNLTDTIDSFDFIFIPTLFAEVILGSKYDLFVNTNSLGEMRNSVIKYWMDFIQNKLEVQYLFTLNRYLNTIKIGFNEWRINENQCSVLYDANWNIIKWELEPGFTRCPYFETIAARTVEIIAERLSSISEDEIEIRSKQFLSEVMDEDWVRLEHSFPPEMTCRDNILVNNMTMDGTLFKLWESIRLDTNEINVGLMIKYLNTLMHFQDKELEEMYYYEDLFYQLFVSKNNDTLRAIDRAIGLKRQQRLQLKSSRNFFSNPHLIEEGYKGFNIIKFNGEYYGLAQKEGAFDIDKVKHRIYHQCFIGKSIAEVKNLIDNSALFEQTNQ